MFLFQMYQAHNGALEIWNNLLMFPWQTGLYNSKLYIFIEYLKSCYSVWAQLISPFHMNFSLKYKNEAIMVKETFFFKYKMLPLSKY